MGADRPGNPGPAVSMTVAMTLPLPEDDRPCIITPLGEIPGLDWALSRVSAGGLCPPELAAGI